VYTDGYLDRHCRQGCFDQGETTALMHQATFPCWQCIRHLIHKRLQGLPQQLAQLSRNAQVLDREICDRTGEVIPDRLHLSLVTTDGTEPALAKIACKA
jgi:hypothetical protein